MIAHGNKPYLECSSKGDKRFSALFARIRARGNHTIEELYQAAKVFEATMPGMDRSKITYDEQRKIDVITNLGWREAKGLLAINIEEVHRLYDALWDEYIAENPELIQTLIDAPGLCDIFGKPGSACQATSLWRIRGKHVPDQDIQPTSMQRGLF